MKKIIFILITSILCYSCFKPQEYNLDFIYLSNNVNSDSSLGWIKIIDYKIPDRKCIEQEKIASIYICQSQKNDKIVKVISYCSDTKFEIGSVLLYSKCDSLISDTIIVHSDIGFEEKHKNLKTYFGTIVYLEE